MAPSTFSFHPSTLMADGAILCSVPRIEKLRNATTAECENSEGHTVEVSFRLVDPPGVSYFSVNCPGLSASHLADGLLICAEAAFVLFTLTVRGTSDHFVYTAGPPGKQSLQLLPYHNAGPFTKHPYALLPCGGDRYAVAFLDRIWISEAVGWQFDASVFSSETQAWSRNRVSLQHLSESDKSLCGGHGLTTQIAVGGDSLGWVDLERGILLLQNLFESHPVIRLIHLPESRVRFIDEDGLPHRPDEYYCNVACCDDLIKFVMIEFDDPAIMTSGQGWKATVWNRKISWNEWRKGSTVDVADISVDQSYSALLPMLRDDETQRMKLKKLIFYTPVLSLHNDDLFYMLGKVTDKEDTVWVVAVDMERAYVEAMACFPDELHYLVTMYRPCVFPKYLSMAPGAGMGNPVEQCFQQLSAEQCLEQVLWTLEWLRELDHCLEIERSTCNTCRSLLQLSPVSSLRSNIETMVKCASSCNVQDEAAYKAVNFCLRALDDFDLAVHESPSAASIEAVRSRISDVLEALDNILRIVPSMLMPKEGMLQLNNESDKLQKGTPEPSNPRVEKYEKKYQKNMGRPWVRKERRAMVDSRLLLFTVCLLVSLVVVMPLYPLNLRKAVW